MNNEISIKLQSGGIIKSYLCKMAGGLGCLGKLTCKVCVVGLYLHVPLCRPPLTLATPEMKVWSGCLTSNGWAGSTLLGAGGTDGAERETTGLCTQ